jgi:hypothetical protein
MNLVGVMIPAPARILNKHDSPGCAQALSFGGAQGGRRSRDDGWASPHARVGYRMIVVSSWGCLGLKDERRQAGS